MEAYGVCIAGFFFGMRRSVKRAAFDASAGLLFDPANIIIRQEADLFERMREVKPCHPHSFPWTEFICVGAEQNGVVLPNRA